MKTYIFASLVLLLSFNTAHAASDYLLKLDGVKGESTTSGTATTETTTRADTTTSPPATGATTGATPTGVGTVAAPTKPQEASTDMFLEIEGIKGESKDDTKKKGNVEYGWKVEEGESAPVRPAVGDIDDGATDPQSLTPDFSILFGGGTDDDCEDGGKDGTCDDARKGTEDCDDADKGVCPDGARAAVADILLKGAQEEGAPVESLSLNFTKIEMKLHNQDAKLFGFIPVSVPATAEMDASQVVKVKFPWWVMLTTGTDADGLGDDIFAALSNVLKTKHDTVKNSIGNIR
jgi:type VI protein secretion system component Hcp